MAVQNVIHYLGEEHVPQDVRRRRRQAQEHLLRMGTPCVVKHKYNEDDVQNGIATYSPNFNDIYGQPSHEDPLSHGVGFVSIELSSNEWVNPDGRTIVVSDTSPGDGYTQAPKYRGFGPGYLIYAVLPDAAEDMFKLDESGALIRVQNARAQIGWYPEVNDNDLLTLVTLNSQEQVVQALERFELKQTTPITHRGLNRRGRRYPNEPMDFGNQFSINQIFELVRIPTNDELYKVEMDR